MADVVKTPFDVALQYPLWRETAAECCENIFMAAASEQHAERLRLAAAVGAIYSYLDAKKAPASLNRYYILKDLDKYIKEPQ